MKQFTTFTSLFILAFFSLTACRKNVEAGATISASGTVFDEVKNKPLPHAKLYLYGAKQTFYGIGYSYGPLDSTVSDNSGKFSIHFAADGQSIDYGLQLGQLEYGSYINNSQTNYVTDNTQPIFKFNYSKNVKNATVKGRELNYTKIHLRVITNPYDTFLVRTSALPIVTLIKGQTIDTTIIVRHLPNQQNIIQYYTEAFQDTIGMATLNANPNQHMYSVRRMISDLINAGMTDTLYVNKTISNSLLMPRQ